jgi:hypothetical protein
LPQIVVKQIVAFSFFGKLVEKSCKPGKTEAAIRRFNGLGAETVHLMASRFTNNLTRTNYGSKKPFKIHWRAM